MAEVWVDHVGIAVRSVEGAREFWQGLGLSVGRSETVEAEGVRVAMMQVGQSRLELLEGLEPDTVIGRFVAGRGPGLHHLALRVMSIEAEYERMRQAGVRLVSDRIGTGAGGHRYFFVHPESTGGVLVELVEG